MLMADTNSYCLPNRIGGVYVLHWEAGVFVDPLVWLVEKEFL